jgi:hypothetical protein
MSYGQVTTVYASAYRRSGVHLTQVYPMEKRRMEFRYNGMLLPEEVITSARFNMFVPSSVLMEDAEISEDQKTASVEIQASYAGRISIRCQVTTDLGNVYPQLVAIQVMRGPWYQDPYPVIGPSQLVVTV